MSIWSFIVAHGSWALPTLVVVVPLFLYGFAPILLVRLIALIYPRGHDRRKEMPGEMATAIKYRDRPMWLAEQLGLAITEGVAARLRLVQGRQYELRFITFDWSSLWAGALCLVIAASTGAGGIALIMFDRAGVIIGALLCFVSLCAATASIALLMNVVRREWTAPMMVHFFLTGADRREA